MSSDTKQVLDGFSEDIDGIKKSIDNIDKKLDAHMREEAFDQQTVKAHLQEAIELMRQAIK